MWLLASSAYLKWGNALSEVPTASAHIWCDLFAGDIVNQAKDSGSKFIISSQKCAAKSVDVKDQLPQQIKVVTQYTVLAADFKNNL